MKLDASHPLGVFDSGLGGLTVVRALRKACPSESILYLGDTARVPYGTRSADTVIRYAVGCARVLVDRGVKAIIVACNTVSAVALEALRVEFDVPVLGVIEPGARAAVSAAPSGPIGVLGTAGMVASGAYPRAIAALSTRAEVIARAAPLLVSLAEEGWLDGEVPELVVRRYLEEIVSRQAKAVVLGCTHFPLLRSVFDKEVARATQAGARPMVIVDSAEATAADVKAFLEARKLARPSSDAPELKLLATDLPKSFSTVASRFLGHEVSDVTAIDL